MHVGSLSKGAGVEEATRVKWAWAKFKELSSILTAHGASYTLMEKIYIIQNCVPSVVTYGTETRAIKAENLH